jgi:hypothetical protein
MSELKPPEQRRWKFVGKFEADTWQDLISLLNSTLYDLHRYSPGQEIPSSISGGYSSSSAYTVTQKPDMTHDAYFAELEAYLEQKRQQEAS